MTGSPEFQARSNTEELGAWRLREKRGDRLASLDGSWPGVLKDFAVHIGLLRQGIRIDHLEKVDSHVNSDKE